MSTRTARKCAVCGDTPAKVHYGVLACFGCKGFFRRAVKDGRNKYVCRFENNCTVTKMERNSCRYCRFRRCLLVGMNPDFVRPDRDDTKQQQKLHRTLSKKKSLGRTNSAKMVESQTDWTTMLSTSHRRTLTELSCLESQLQQWGESSYEGVAHFSLRSLIADRTLARKTKVSSSMGSSPSPALMGIDRVVASIDFIDGFLANLGETSKKVTVEDKCALISECFLPLSLVDSVARLIAHGSANFAEDFTRSANVKDLGFSFAMRFSNLCEAFKQRPPSPMEYSIVRAYLVCSADASVLSNLLGDQLSLTRDVLNELLFRVIKLSRGMPSTSAASTMANLVTFVHNAKSLSSILHTTLSSLHPRVTAANFPFQKIISDILHPEPSDLVAQMCGSRSYPSPSVSTSSSLTFVSTPQTSPSMNTNINNSSCSMCPPYPVVQEHAFTAPRPLRPTALGFCSKLPLTITKSIEEMLRAPGVGDDLNRPLAMDWADGVRLTPVFNKDVVAQFFPELSGTLL